MQHWELAQSWPQFDGEKWEAWKLWAQTQASRFIEDPEAVRAEFEKAWAVRQALSQTPRSYAGEFWEGDSD